MNKGIFNIQLCIKVQTQYFTYCHLPFIHLLLEAILLLYS